MTGKGPSPDFEERVMSKVQMLDRMALLYQRAKAEGFVVRRDPDRRGIVFAMPADLRAEFLKGDPDPRFGTVADLMEHEAAMFDFLEASDRLAAAILSDGPVEDPPPVKGGQGREDEEVRDDARAVLFVLGLLAIVLGFGVGVYWLATGGWGGGLPK